MIIADNQTDIDINIAILEKIANSLNITRDIELIIVDNNTIKQINSEQRGIDKATDVLSFPLEDMAHMPLGSIVISSEFTIKLAKELKHSINDELALLFTHGLLHLLEYDHEIDNGEMREKEREIITKFNLPKSLIIRTQGE